MKGLAQLRQANPRIHKYISLLEGDLSLEENEQVALVEVVNHLPGYGVI